MIKFINSCDVDGNTLDVRFTKKCDNDCSFCIEKQGIHDLGHAPVKELIKQTISQNKDTILILGGEPFLEIKRLQEYVQGIEKHVKEIFITTSLPKTILKNPKIFNDIMKRIKGLNVSILDTNSHQNNILLNTKSKHDRLELLQTINLKWAYKVRTSINLVKNGIDNKIDLLYSLTNLQILGCKSVKINELQNSSENYISYENIMGVKLPSAYSYGCQALIQISGIEVNMILKRSCFLVEETLNAKFIDLIKSLIKKYLYKKTGSFSVLYENATIQNEWKRK